MAAAAAVATRAAAAAATHTPAATAEKRARPVATRRWLVLRMTTAAAAAHTARPHKVKASQAPWGSAVAAAPPIHAVTAGTASLRSIITRSPGL
jgi:hypothetical protein